MRICGYFPLFDTNSYRVLFYHKTTTWKCGKKTKSPVFRHRIRLILLQVSFVSIVQVFLPVTLLANLIAVTSGGDSGNSFKYARKIKRIFIT